VAFGGVVIVLALAWAGQREDKKRRVVTQTKRWDLQSDSILAS